MAKYTQAGRAFRVVSSMADDELMLVGFSGEEEMSAPGGFSLDLASPKGTLPAKDFLNQKLGVVIETSGGTKRYIHGFVRRFGVTGRDEELTLYRAEIVPWIWLLSLYTDCLIFQNLSVPDIVEKVFKDHGFTDFENRCLKTYPPREFCLQYRENCLAFVSRLLEDEGIFYFVEHSEKGHMIVLADNPSKIVACPGLGEVTMVGGIVASKDSDTLSTMHEEEQLTSGTVTYGDFNYLAPTSKLNIKNAGTKYGKLEHYDYPGGYQVSDEGNRYAELKLQEFEAAQRTAFGSGEARAFTAGHKFTLSQHTRKGMNIEWTLLKVSHSGENSSYHAGGEQGEESYSNSFVAMPHSVRFLPPEITPRPLMNGTQTATVVGKSGEEIWTDKYGRVKIQFHWDRTGKNDETSSIWVRVASPWAGKNFGFVAIPRMGHEVVVDFLEGDPDRPIIVGSVYNADNMPPWDLPANQTQAGIHTRSAKGGTYGNANALRFEDKKGSEQLWLHAEKNQDIEVENDETHWVGHDRTKTIDHDETVHVKNNRTTTIDKNDYRYNMEGDEYGEVKKGSKTQWVHKDSWLTVEEGDKWVVVQQGDAKCIIEKGMHHHQVRIGDSNYFVDKGTHNVVVGEGDKMTFVQQGKCVTQVDQGDLETLVKMGNITIKAKMGKIAIEAMQEIELKVGQNTIKISNTGVEIKGMTVKAEGQIQTSIKGLMTEVKGDAMLQAKGAITMIG